MMATTLYHGEPNGPSLTVLAALFETGLQAELQRIDLAAGDRHSGAVPTSLEVEMSIEGEGPVLVADGEAMADSVFLANYLDEAAGRDVIVPADPYERWQVMTWCRWIIERAAPAAALLGNRAWSAGRLGTVGEIGSADLKQRWDAVSRGEFPDTQVADSEGKIRMAVERTEKQLGDGDWLFGRFGLADLETYAWLAGMVELVPDAFADAPRTRAWLERVRARPSVAKAVALATIEDPRRAWAPGPEINRWG